MKENFAKGQENIRIDLKEIDIYTRNWVQSAQDRDYWRTLVNVERNLFYFFKIHSNIVLPSTHRPP